MNIVTIPLDRIDMGDRLRAIDEDQAQVIAASMMADGQRTPIEVRTPGLAGLYPLIAGAHRCRAAELAGLHEIAAVVKDVSALDAERLEIEENLCRHELTELDRAVFLARWQAVHEAIANAPRHGGSRRKGQADQVRKLAHLTETDAPPPRFSFVAAERLGLSEGHIRRAKLRAAIVPEARAKLVGTWMADNGSALDGLRRLKPPYQVRVAELVVAKPEERSFAALRVEALGIRQPVVDQRQAELDALLKLWRRTGAWARDRFRAEMAKDAMFNLESQDA